MFFNKTEESQLMTARGTIAGQTTPATPRPNGRPFDAAVVLDSAVDGILALDLAGVVRVANAPAAAMLGKAGSSIVGRSIDCIAPSLLGRSWPELLQDARDGVGTTDIAVEMERQIGASELTVRVSPIVVAGEVAGVSLVLRDISERRRLEIQLERKNAELQSVNDDLQRSNRELERFAYAASHDLQEPLRMVHSYVELLDKRYGDQFDEDARDFMGFAIDGAKRMRAMINSLLTLSRVIRSPLVLEEVDLNDVVRDVLQDLEVELESTRASVDVTDLPVLHVDGAQFRSVIQNLVANALKYSEEPPVLQITAARSENEWQIVITDNGIGIPDDARDVVFEPFKRLRRHGSSSGSGLGLALARTVVERHGGRIWVDAAPQKGSSFSFTIPEGTSR